MSKILCVGSAVVDFIFNFNTFPDKAEKHVASDASIVGGGIAANAAVAIAKLGGQPVLSGQLGDDQMASLILSDLEEVGVDVANVTKTQGARSSYSSVYINAQGERQIANFRGENLSIKTEWYAEIDDLSAALVDTRIPEAAKAALTLARDRSIPGIVDGEAPIDEKLLELASHVAFSLQGLRSLGDGDVTTLLADTASKYQCWACVTDGENGVTIADGNGVKDVSAYAVDVVDTLAAGDVWHGAFAFALADGKSEIDAVQFANAVGAIKCTRSGGREGAPTLEEVTRFMNGSV